jgi:tetratricopeptide (TPR) repeat protein
MPMRITSLLSLCLALCFAGRAFAQTPAHQHYQRAESPQQSGPAGILAPRLQKLGTHVFPVSTKSTQAQQFINQGVNLTYGFNHAEAGRAFAEAARLDPSCAMAYWGQALVLGPNINAAMAADDEPKAQELVKKAVAAQGCASPRERGYISALSVRYTGKAEDRGRADRAYAEAMQKLSRQFPRDLDAGTLYAESLMDLRPWNYWTRDGLPQEGTQDAIASLQRVLSANPNHPGALHYWIHLWEPTKTPERAEKEADRLLPLMPGAGHIIHMPAHIYLRVGRYVDAVKANQVAVAADEDYIAQCRAQGMYPLGYYPHNIHFIWMGATMSGQSALAIAAANKVARAIPLEALAAAPPLQGFLVVPYHALVQFGKWDEILALPAPAHDTIFTRGVWHYARGRAFAGKGQLDDAAKELAALEKIVADPALPTLPASASLNSADAILRVAPEVLAGDIAARRKDFDTAVARLGRGVRLEDALAYTEPADWPQPVRHLLGAVLLEAGRPVEAEAVYWDDLRKNAENGWSLFGLVQALTAQGKKDEAAQAQQRFQKAWAMSDIQLTARR